MPKEIYIDENGNERILSSSPSALSGLLDTDITTPSANQVLSYDGSKWENKTLAESDITNLVSDLAKKTTMYSSSLKYSGSSTTSSFTITTSSTDKSGFILFLGDGNGKPILSIVACHEGNIDTSNYTNLGSQSTSVSASGNTITITIGQWARVQAFSNLPIS